MKVVILAGGLGTRLSEETEQKPKPMVEIGGRPILWHIMKVYSHFGFNDFIILTGYKGHIIKDFFLNYYTRYSDITIDMQKNDVQIHEHRAEPWTVTMLYTGEDTMTGSRLLKAKVHLANEPFMLAYGDCIGNVNLPELIDFHKKKGKIATVTAVQPKGRYGVLSVKNNLVESFREKPESDAWISGGFFVMQPQIFDYMKTKNNLILESDVLSKLAKDSELACYKHSGFWHPMDTLKDKLDLTNMWMTGQAPWAIWK
jgi:glucose-1-phosphate cytidylyltransferase